MRKVRIAAIPYQLRPIRDFQDFTRQVEFFLESAQDYEADFALLPELFTTQMMSFFENRNPETAIRHLDEYTERLHTYFKASARSLGQWIVGGTHPTLRDGELFNVASLYGPDGQHYTQDKIHLTPSEVEYWKMTRGEKLRVFETPKGRVAILVCYDLEFPELARVACEAGAEIIFTPFATDERRGYLRVRYCGQARCVENQVYVAQAGTIGNLPRVPYMLTNYGGAGIYTPCDFWFSRDGIAAESRPNDETIIVADVDLDLIAEARREGSVRNWQDRRPSVYSLSAEVVGAD